MNRNQIIFLLYSLLAYPNSKKTPQECLDDAHLDASRLNPEKCSVLNPGALQKATALVDGLNLPETKPLPWADDVHCGHVFSALAVYRNTGNYKISAIKAVRAMTGTTIRVAKDFVEGKISAKKLRESVSGQIHAAEQEIQRLRDDAKDEFDRYKEREDAFRRQIHERDEQIERMRDRMELLERLANTQAHLLKEIR